MLSHLSRKIPNSQKIYLTIRTRQNGPPQVRTHTPHHTQIVKSDSTPNPFGRKLCERDDYKIYMEGYGCRKCLFQIQCTWDKYWYRGDRL